MMALNTRLERDDSERRNWEWKVALNAKLQEIDEGGNMPQCSVPPQLSIHWKGLKETPWVSEDALLVSQNDQIDYEHSLTTPLTKSRDMMKCHNK